MMVMVMVMVMVSLLREATTTRIDEQVLHPAETA